jgi:DsbC/DsbD-like thiol-disulfide interchange protein
MRRLLLAALLLLPTLPSAETRALAALTQGLAGGPAAMVRLDVLPGWREADGRHMAGLRLTLAPGWKTYWRAPGSAGLPPRFDFRGSVGIEGADLRWPVPDLFEAGGFRSIGYHDAVTIPVELQLLPGAGPVRLAGEAEIGVCEAVCVPVRLAFAADLPPEGARDPAIAAALAARPLTAGEAGARATCTLAPSGDGLALTVRVAVPDQGGEEAVVVETADPALWVSETESAREGGTLTAVAEALARDGGPASVDRSALRITVLGEHGAVDIRGCDAA